MLNSMDEKKKGGKKVDPTLYSHDDGVVNLKEPPGKLQATQAETDEEMLQVIVTRILLGSYFSISRGVLADTVPKAVMHFLVNSVGRGLQQHLIQSLYHPNIVPSLLMEHPETEAKRQAAKAKLSALSSAASAMGSMPADLAAAGAEAAESALTRLLCMINMIHKLKTTSRRDETSLIAIARGASPRVPRTRASR